MLEQRIELGLRECARRIADGRTQHHTSALASRERLERLDQLGADYLERMVELEAQQRRTLARRQVGEQGAHLHSELGSGDWRHTRQPSSSGGSPHRRLDPMLVGRAMPIPEPWQQIDWSSAPDATHPRLEPSAGEKTTAFVPGGRVRCDHVNWLLYSLDQWNDWFDEFITTIGDP